MTSCANLQRRAILLGSLGISAGVVVSPISVWAEIANSEGSNASQVFLEQLCDLVIPKTQTPGAKEVGVANFVHFAAQHGLKSGYAGIVDVFEKAVNKYVGEAFLQLKQTDQVSALTQIDQQVFSRQKTHDFAAELLTWKPIKSLILLGYYTSKVGASEELRYLLIPGHFDPDVPVTSETRAWSSDWTGVKFG